MKKFVITFVFLLSASCLFGQSEKESLTKTDQEFLSFFKEFREIIRSDDREKISEYINFPLYEYNCEIIYKNKYQFINNISNEDYETFDNNDFMKYLQNNLKYFDKIEEFDPKVVEREHNPFISISVEIMKRETGDYFKQELCYPETYDDFYYSVSIIYNSEDSASGEYFHFLKINNRYKLISYNIAG